MSEKSESGLRWLEFELKQRDFHQRSFHDFNKLGAEFSKLLISSLVAVNSGGLVSLPALAVFIGADKLEMASKVSIFALPAGLYSLGLLSALGTAVGAYFNFNALAAHQLKAVDVSILHARKFRAITLDVTSTIVEEVEKSIAEATKSAAPFDRSVKWSYRFSHLAGWVSLLAFIAGGISMVLHRPL